MAEDSENGARRRPEDIVAGAFLDRVPASATEGWSDRSRRTILLVMAGAGAVIVIAGLLLTGGLGPGPGRPRPIQAGPDASVFARSLLRPLAEQQDVTATTTPAGALPGSSATTLRRGNVPVVPTATQGTPPPVSAQTSPSSPPPPTTSTTRPCAVVGDRVATAVQLPPICPPG